MKVFLNEKEASQWMYDEVLSDELCVDNYRFAFQDDNEAMTKYTQAEDCGCCGFFDQEIIVDNRIAKIGCNYGH